MSHPIKEGDIGQDVGYVFYIVGVIAAFAFILSALRYRKLKPWRKIRNDTIAIALVGLFPVIWTMILLNHTSYHWFFTYRISMISSLACEMIAVYMFEPRKKKKKQKWEKWKKLKALKPTRII
jgi:presenilin-like A22 family membrane protease